jgi:hypothetical protein
LSSSRIKGGGGGGVVLEPFLYHRLEYLVPVNIERELAVAVTDDLVKGEV